MVIRAMIWQQSIGILHSAKKKAVAARVILDTRGTSPAEAIWHLAGAWELLSGLLAQLPEDGRVGPRILGVFPWLFRIHATGASGIAATHNEKLSAAVRALQAGEPVAWSRRDLLKELTTLSRALSAAHARCIYQCGSSRRRVVWTGLQFLGAFGVLSTFALLAAGVYVFIAQPGITEGLTAYYWRFPTEKGASMERIDHQVDFNWGKKGPFKGYPADNFFVRWEGCIEVSDGDTALLEAGADDAVKVIVDGRETISDWDKHKFRIRKAAKPLSAGKHPIRVEYQERVGIARVYLGWSLNGQSAVPVPPRSLLPRVLATHSTSTNPECPKMPALKK